MARRWTVAAVACLATALLAGCSGGTQRPSTTLPKTSAPAAASPTLPPLGPPDFPVPAEARAKTPEGVTAFTRYYVALINHQLTTLDATPLRTLSRNCTTCTALADSYDRGRAAGHRYQGGALTVESAGNALVDGSDAEVTLLLTEEQVTVFDSTGAAISALSKPPAHLSGGMTFQWDNSQSSWLVTQLTADKV